MYNFPIVQKGLNYFKGKCFLKYNHEQFLWSEILEGYIKISKWMIENFYSSKIVKIRLDKNISNNTIFISSNKHNKTSSEISFELKDFKLYNILIQKNNSEFSVNMDPGEKIKKVILASPALSSDKRWNSIDLPSSSFFIASMLADNSFSVSVKKLELPFIKTDEFFNEFDLSGFTLYEDLFTEFKEFIFEFNKNNKNLKAAGGPLVTLNPLQALFFLPEINLFVRGESEFILSEIITSINDNNFKKLLENGGFVFQKPGLLIISDFDKINRPVDLSGINFNLSFIKKDQMRNGIEINLSRGCVNSCIFCSRIQGKEVRQLPEKNIEELLKSYSKRAGQFGIETTAIKTININDDDILQDEVYSRNVFDIIKKNAYSLWGIQSSISSFYTKDKLIDKNKISIIADKDLYTDNNALLWVGTDTFLSERGKRLGKLFPYKEVIYDIVNEFEKNEITNYHYWISSDFNSTWGEFIKEMKIIYDLGKKFKSFSILAHSPFLIPYSSTPLYKYLTGSSGMGKQVKLKKFLNSSNELFDFPLVLKVETRFINLNRLLCNESMPGRKGFFTYLKSGDFLNSFVTIYDFLKNERLFMESAGNFSEAESLKILEENLEDFIAKLI